MSLTVSVPLIFPVRAVIYRLDIQATWAVDPPGEQDKGYDEILREPVIYRTAAGDRASPRVEMAPVKIKVQEETKTSEQLRMAATGNDELSTVVFVTHRRDLELQNLIDLQTGNCKLKAGDRISHLERLATTTKIRQWHKPLYVYRVDDGMGLGIDYSLHLIWTSHRDYSARSTQEI